MRQQSSQERIAAAVGQLVKDRPGIPVVDEPTSVYELVTRKMVEQLSDDVKRALDLNTWLLRLVGGAIVVDVVIRVIGVE